MPLFPCGIPLPQLHHLDEGRMQTADVDPFHSFWRAANCNGAVGAYGDDFEGALFGCKFASLVIDSNEDVVVHVVCVRDAFVDFAYIIG